MARTAADPWRVTATVLLGLVVVAFWGNPLLYPLKLTVVFFHELSHAIAAWLTGGEVLRIGLGIDESGVTLTRGGWPLIILNAGYFGSLLWGVGLMMASQRTGWSRPMLGLLGGLLGLVAVGFVRPFVSFGFLFALLVSGALIATCRRVSEATAAAIVQALGTFSVLYAVLDIRSDVLSTNGAAVSDATMLAQATGVPAFLWGFGWIIAGGTTLWMLRRRL
jgi:hypothetical protein